MLKIYTTILLTLLLFSHSMGQGPSIVIQRVKTCIEPAYDFVNNCIEQRVIYRNKSYVKLYYLGHLRHSVLKKKHRLYYARVNADSSLSHRRVYWKRALRRDSIIGKYYTLILAKDYDNYTLYYKEKKKQCDLCANEEKILYLDEPVPKTVKRDPIIFNNAFYKHPLLKPNYLRIKINKQFIPHPELYFEDSLKLEKVKWKEPRWREKGYYYALIPVTRNNLGTKVGPIVYKEQIHCPYEPKPSPPTFNVNPDRSVGNYFSGLKMDMSFIPHIQSQFVSLGYHKRFNRQSLNLSLQYSSSHLITPRVQYQFYLINKRNYNHLRYRYNASYYDYFTLKEIQPLTYTQLYLGTEYIMGKINEEWSAFQRLYIGYNKQVGYLNIYMNYGVNGVFNQLPRTTRYLELGLKINIPLKRQPLVQI